MSTETSSSPVTGANYLRGVVSRELTSALGREHVSERDADRQAAAADWGCHSKVRACKDLGQPAPDFVVHPANTAGLARVVEIASDFGLSLIHI